MKFSRGNSRVTQLLLSFARSQELQKKLIKLNHRVHTCMG